jgi:dCTP deaminase
VLPYQAIRQAEREGVIRGAPAILPEQLQPASIDLRLGPVAYRVRASFLPGAGRTVREKLDQFRMHEIDLTRGAVLERGCVYIVQLAEWLRLPSRMSALANPKSSTGRLDIFTRLITENATAFDRVGPGYAGPLYAEIAPRTFSILVREGSRLNQLRLRRGSPSSSNAALRSLHADQRLVTTPDGAAATIFEDRIGVTLDLDCADAGLTGWRAKKHTDVIDIDLRGHYEVEDFWEPIKASPSYGLILDPDDFYILSTREYVKVPRDWAAEMVAYDTMVGEFRVHYAGFFDPGFGEGEGNQSKAVLEVRSHEVPFLLEHGQLVGWLRYERLAQSPDRAYGEGIGSNYQRQGLALAKQFKQPR